MRVSMSATGSVIDIRELLCPLPTGLGHAGDVPAEREVAEADAAELELAEESARPPAHLAAVALPGRKLRLPLSLDDHRGLCHVLSLLAERHAQLAQKHAGLLVVLRR